MSCARGKFRSDLLALAEVVAAHLGNDSRTLERTIVVHVSRVTAGDRCDDEWPKALVTLTNLPPMRDASNPTPPLTRSSRAPTVRMSRSLREDHR